VILEAIRRDGPLTRLELGGRTGLTGPGITNILRRLGDTGLVTARKRAEAGSGQPSTEFAIDPDGAFGLGVRLHGGSGEVVVLDLAGRIRESRTIDLSGDANAALKRAIGGLGTMRSSRARILGVGIGVDDPSSVSPDALAAALRPFRVSVERDCVTALLAERTFGVGAVEGGAMLIILDDHIRAGFLFRGVPFGGVHGKAGSIGLMRTGADHVPLDTVAGLGELRKIMTPAERAALAAGTEMPLSAPVKAWIREAAGHLLDAIVATAGFLAPGAILIGGDLPRPMIEELIAQMSVERGDTAIRPFITPWISPIRPASFPQAGIALGAAMLPFFDLLLPPVMPGG